MRKTITNCTQHKQEIVLVGDFIDMLDPMKSGMAKLATDSYGLDVPPVLSTSTIFIRRGTLTLGLWLDKLTGGYSICGWRIRIH
jgi:hypothetical protein